MRPHFFKLALFIAIVISGSSDSIADVLRDPIGVNVSAAKPMSLTVRFATSDGALFTSDQALFCFRQLANGQCDPSAILGQLPSNRDRGSTNIPTSRITDVMTIPYSVIRSTLSIAQQVDFSDFFYVRRFIPAPGADLGAGVDQVVYQKVTCHLAGPARIPLSLTKVSLFAREPYRDDPVKLIRLNKDNLDNGKIYATIDHTGTGTIEGWWEIRRPGDPAIREFDLLPQAALPPAERGLQNRYFRLKRFRAKATTEGLVMIEGPKYSELPRNITGRHDILLRFPAGRGRENRARLDVAGEPVNVFSGAIAGFRIPFLEYHVPVAISEQTAESNLASRLLQSQDDDGNTLWNLAWQAPEQNNLILRFKINNEVTSIAPASDGYMPIKTEWPGSIEDLDLRVDLVDLDGSVYQTDQSVAIE